MTLNKTNNNKSMESSNAGFNPDQNSGHDTWHELFDWICERRGYRDNKELAHLICHENGKTEQHDFEAMLRNLHNWRSGSHTPSRKNFRLLSNVLDVDAQPEHRVAWKALYGKVARHKKEHGGADRAVSSHYFWSRILGTQFLLTTVVAIAAVFILLTMVFGLLDFAGSSTAAVEEEWKSNNIPWRGTVSAKVGDKIVIHGHRGNCGEMAPNQEATAAKLPQIDTGTLSPGNLGMRVSRSCGGATPAREVIFHAERPGTESIILFEDRIDISVSN